MLAKSLELFPKNGYAYYYLGDCYADLADKKKAIENYEKALEIIQTSKHRNDINRKLYEMKKK